ncbi:MAG: flagellin [Verrucomicrobiales bacterium]|jgi:flagellar hook-associated protein 3 FlgL|nr:flagellin [Verrucomicrobiales bacterium]
MRITANTFLNSLSSQLSVLTQRQNRLQSQAATGQRIQTADDDPAAMQRVLNLQAESGRVGQLQSNISHQQDLATASYSSIISLKKLSDRASEIATSVDGLKSPKDLAVYASEIDQILQQAVSVANTKNQGDYLFAGTKTNAAPFAVSTDANGKITSVAYNGNQDLAAAEVVEGATVSSQVPGGNPTGSGPRGLFSDSASGSDFFAHLISLRDHLSAGTPDAVTAIETGDRPGLAKDEDNIIFQLSQNGAVQSRLETAAASAKDRLSGLNIQTSKQTNADLADTLVRLNQTQNAYQAALQSAGTIMHISLLDYLR